jgi:hypothetical protein
VPGALAAKGCDVVGLAQLPAGNWSARELEMDSAAAEPSPASPGTAPVVYTIDTSASGNVTSFRGARSGA